MITIDEKPCAVCGQPMRLIKILPSVATLPELRTYKCDACGVMVTDAIEDEKRFTVP